jgi:hypothetical protein
MASATSSGVKATMAAGVNVLKDDAEARFAAQGPAS